MALQTASKKYITKKPGNRASRSVNKQKFGKSKNKFKKLAAKKDYRKPKARK